MAIAEFIFDPTNGPTLKLRSLDGAVTVEFTVGNDGRLKVDGTGLDADTLDGLNSTAFATAAHAPTHDAAGADPVTAQDTSSGAAPLGRIMETDGSGGWALISTPTGAGISDNFVYSYDTTTQALSAGNTFQALTFNTNDELDGWTHVTGTNVFGCTQTAKYEVIMRAYVESTTDSIASAATRALFNSVEVPGSHSSVHLPGNNTVHLITSQFIVDATSGQDLETEFAGSDAGVRALPGPDPAAATTVVSAALTIRRIN